VSAPPELGRLERLDGTHDVNAREDCILLLLKGLVCSFASSWRISSGDLHKSHDEKVNIVEDLLRRIFTFTEEKVKRDKKDKIDGILTNRLLEVTSRRQCVHGVTLNGRLSPR